MKSFIKKVLSSVGQPTPPPVDPLASFHDLNDQERAIIRAAQPFTMTSPERLAALIEAVKYIVKNNIGGDIAECGVWRGGSMLAIAKTLLAVGDTSRRLYLYDTFEGMSAPTEHDRDLENESAAQQMEEQPRDSLVWAIASLDEVKRNVLSSGYPTDKISFIKGKVEDTIPATLPAALSLLRLDTDWYESTRHELIHLYPLLSRLGLLLIDDYGHWQGSRKAVDEFAATLPNPLFFHRIDYTGRIAVKI